MSSKFCHTWFRTDSLAVPITLACQHLLHWGTSRINPLISQVLSPFLLGNNERCLKQNETELIWKIQLIIMVYRNTITGSVFSLLQPGVRTEADHIPWILLLPSLAPYIYIFFFFYKYIFFQSLSLFEGGAFWQQDQAASCSPLQPGEGGGEEGTMDTPANRLSICWFTHPINKRKKILSNDVLVCIAEYLNVMRRLTPFIIAAREMPFCYPDKKSLL